MDRVRLVRFDLCIIDFGHFRPALPTAQPTPICLALSRIQECRPGLAPSLLYPFMHQYHIHVVSRGLWRFLARQQLRVSLSPQLRPSPGIEASCVNLTLFRMELLRLHHQ
jgi:hypothetical protein